MRGGEATLFLPAHPELAETSSFPMCGTLSLGAMRERSKRSFSTDGWPGLFMNAVARRLRPKPAGASRK